MVKHIVRALGMSFVLSLMLVSALPRAAGQQRQDQPGTSVQARTGRDLFKVYCATCHGVSARGDGPLAEDLRRRPPDLTQFAKQNGGQFPAQLVRRIIDGRQKVKLHGGPEMPVWGDAFRMREGLNEQGVSARIDAIVQYLASIQERQGH